MLALFASVLAGAGTLPAQGVDQPSESTIGDLLQIGQEIWDENAPPELKDQYRLPTVEEVETFLADMEADLAEGTPQRLAAYAPQARIALQALRSFEGGESLADWLEPRLDFLVAAEEIQNEPPATPPAPERPNIPPKLPTPVRNPQYTRDYWQAKVASHVRPKQAERYMPVFKKAFESKGVPPELAWLSEVESSMKLTARSPVGAYGPFQFMPATAKRFGLRVGSPDDRADPRKSAEAAATYLGLLYQRFHSWPLAIAAYNAGEGRVEKAIGAAASKRFDDVSPHLPTETRMYVPKVLATVALRESIDPDALPGI